MHDIPRDRINAFQVTSSTSDDLREKEDKTSQCPGVEFALCVYCFSFKVFSNALLRNNFSGLFSWWIFPEHPSGSKSYKEGCLAVARQIVSTERQPI